MRKTLSRKFFNRDTELVAQELLGKFLVHKIGKTEIAVMITETEAYDGHDDKASHASKGRTTRTEVMFGHPGFFYVYLVYGMYYMLNIVTREHGYPAAVLIRGAALESHSNILENVRMGLTGPGKVTRYLRINKALNAKKAEKVSGLWFEDRGIKINPKNIKKTARIGVSYAGPVWSSKKRRYIVKI